MEGLSAVLEVRHDALNYSAFKIETCPQARYLPFFSSQYVPGYRLEISYVLEITILFQCFPHFHRSQAMSGSLLFWLKKGGELPCPRFWTTSCNLPDDVVHVADKYLHYQPDMLHRSNGKQGYLDNETKILRKVTITSSISIHAQCLQKKRQKRTAVLCGVPTATENKAHLCVGCSGFGFACARDQGVVNPMLGVYFYASLQPMLLHRRGRRSRGSSATLCQKPRNAWPLCVSNAKYVFTGVQVNVGPISSKAGPRHVVPSTSLGPNVGRCCQANSAPTLEEVVVITSAWGLSVATYGSGRREGEGKYMSYSPTS